MAALRRIPLHVVVIAVAVIWTVPLLGLVVSAFRPSWAVLSSGWWESFALPGDYTLENYQRVLDRDGMALSLFNSLAVVVPATVLTLAIGAAAAYALAGMRFRLRSAVLLTIVALIIVPIQITLVPLLKVFNTLDLTGSFLGIWLVHLGFGLPFAVYLLHNFFAAIPRELFEAAEMDGAGRGQIFFSIVLPVARPALAALAIFDFVWTWNDLLVALIFLGGFRDVAPMTVAVSQLVASRGDGWEILTSAAVLSVLVPMGVFVALQRHFVRGLLAGVSKG
ncbi:carbohydrate ABC transporter permease [Jiangella sp. DSM 45060]|uniref:carbohydrate ABC transporter permease n=1 Tax=Jiangella sp. DSM 45060 TaxID=1798224 RepID=UPI00087D808A|nr:carbohydrate ABC transporter permease [Jiangella sp. DSM 45060]SDT72627.1 carbohydrate ABC transporter membrane protein 2, CUT1 family [Jiangella sp. DSM 45060]